MAPRHWLIRLMVHCHWLTILLLHVTRPHLTIQRWNK
jgi:hypothetical protein